MNDDGVVAGFDLRSLNHLQQSHETTMGGWYRRVLGPTSELELVYHQRLLFLLLHQLRRLKHPKATTLTAQVW